MDLDFETVQLIKEEFQKDFQLPQRDNISDSFLARRLQEQFQRELRLPSSSNNRNEISDLLLARNLQEQLEHEQKANTSLGDLVYDKKIKNRDITKSLIDPSWEVIDPTPDIHVLFMAFNNKFFWGQLDSVCVSWSKRMKRCAGICSYQGRGGLCHITLSEPLLKLRPRKDLIETLLHEMIHALLFVTNNNKDRDGHGPEFHKHMYRINKEAGTNITVYHSFHDEVELYLQHWWRCNGPCQKWKPFFGIVRRSMNRAPGPNDRWWGQHSRSCGGTFIKIKSPEPKVKESKKAKEVKPVYDIKKFISSSSKSGNLKNSSSKSSIQTSISQTTVKAGSSNGITSNILNVTKSNSGLPTSVTITSKTNNIHGFSNSISETFVNEATKMNSNTIVVTKKATPISQEKKKDNEIKNNISIASQGKRKSSDNKETSIDYSIVRNHWINKFPKTKASKNPERVYSNKRKSTEIIPVVFKTPKFNDNSSQDSLDCDYVQCPVCNILYPIDELNTHLDTCLTKPKNQCRKCIVCLKNVNKSEYQEHVNKCLEKNFKDTPEKKSQNDNSIIIIEDDDMDINFVTCSICKNQVDIEDLEEHSKICENRSECPECGKKIHSSSFDIHLADCLMKKLEAMDQYFDSDGIKKKPDCSNNEEKINCLVCGKHVLKINLYLHFDECMKEVFDEKEDQVVDADENDDKLYNCPFCLKLFTEIDMSNHIDICLKTEDGDAEAEKNKNLFLSEITE